MSMKILAMCLNGAALLLCAYLFIAFNIPEPVYLSVYFLLTLIALTDWSSMFFINVMLFVNICASCLSVIAFMVLLVDGLRAGYALSLPAVLALLVMLLVVAMASLVVLVKHRKKAFS